MGRSRPHTTVAGPVYTGSPSPKDIAMIPSLSTHKQKAFFDRNDNSRLKQEKEQWTVVLLYGTSDKGYVLHRVKVI